MNDLAGFVAFGSAKRRIRPSNWIYRLLEIAAVHWQKESGTQPCAMCCDCPDTMCFTIPLHLKHSHPSLVSDLSFCLRMLEIPEISAQCPRCAELRAVPQRNAA